MTLPSTRPLLLALTIPNGLVAGCEALFVPYAGDAAAALFLAGAAGMLVGDVLVGRVLDAASAGSASGGCAGGWRRRSSASSSARAYRWRLSWRAAPASGTPRRSPSRSCSSSSPRRPSGQILGAESAARATCQGLGALLAGALAESIDPGHAIAALGVVSLLVTAALTRPLARATQPRPQDLHHPAGTEIATNKRRNKECRATASSLSSSG